MNNDFKFDVYSKIIMTVIAVSLFLMAIQMMLPENAEAQYKYIYIANPEDIAIAIATHPPLDPIPVEVTNSLQTEITNAMDIGYAVYHYSD